MNERDAAINRAIIDLHTVTKCFGQDGALRLILGKLHDEGYCSGAQAEARDAAREIRDLHDEIRSLEDQIMWERGG